MLLCCEGASGWRCLVCLGSDGLQHQVEGVWSGVVVTAEEYIQYGARSSSSSTSSSLSIPRGADQSLSRDIKNKGRRSKKNAFPGCGQCETKNFFFLLTE